ncbi:IS3 family transposase, partial [Ralstonia pseudosolanacearum]
KHGFSDASFYTWRAKFGGMEVSEARRLKELEAENAKLKKLLAEAMLDMEALKVVVKGKPLSPQAKREAVVAIRRKVSISERRACRLVGLSRSVLHYEAQTAPGNEILKARLVELAHERRRFGYRRLHVLLEREGLHANHKRVHRLYREAGLAVRRRRRRHGVMVERERLALPAAPNEVWSIDFVMDALSNGRRLKCLTIVDDFTKEAVDIVVDHGISGLYVARALDHAARFRGYPKALRTDQGPEFTSRALDQWAYASGVSLKLIQAGKPTQNAYIESFNGKFRDECLNEHWFTSLAHARAVIAAWRQDYNEARPHSALNYQPPAEFAARYRATAVAPAAQEQT